jgi:hypothetical protein
MKLCHFLIPLTFLLLAASLNAGDQIIFYHGNYGLINQTIDISLQKGLNEYSHHNVPVEIIENSVVLQPVNRDGFLVQTQSFLKETGRFFNILSQYKDKELEIVTNDGSLISGFFFFYDGEMVGIEDKKTAKSLFIRNTEIRNFSLKSSEYRYQPDAVISWTISTEKTGNQAALLSYLTGGLHWTSIYKAIWDEDYLELEILANIVNNTGVDYQDFTISLVAGDPKRIAVRPSNVYGRGKEVYADSAMMESMPSSPPSFVADELDEYHVYSYTKPVSIQHSESKQIRLYPPVRTKPEVYYEYFTNSNNLLTRLKIINDEKNGLGFPLPRGSVQVYRRNDNNSGLNFVGEDAVEQRPVKEEWIISPGIAFDLVGETILLETRRPTRTIVEYDRKVILRNRSKETKAIVVTHDIRGNWSILRETHAHERINANQIQFRKELKPDEKFEFTWTERIES